MLRMGLSKKLFEAGPKLVFLASGALLVIAFINIWHFGGAAYYASTGRPLSWPSLGHPTAKARALPQFQVTEVIGQTSLSPGQTQTVEISAKPNKSTMAALEVWITGPHNKQVWKSPADPPFQYIGGVNASAKYSYTLPSTSTPGTYTFSALIRSADDHTDYFIKESFAEFSVL